MRLLLISIYGSFFASVA